MFILQYSSVGECFKDNISVRRLEYSSIILNLIFIYFYDVLLIVYF